MPGTVISCDDGQIEASLEGDIWTLRLGVRKSSSSYLDFALVQLLETNTAEVHRLAAKILEQLLIDAQSSDCDPATESVRSVDSHASERAKRLQRNLTSST
jgi:uncharacterized protein with FMN-binding domain